MKETLIMVGWLGLVLAGQAQLLWTNYPAGYYPVTCPKCAHVFLYQPISGQTTVRRVGTNLEDTLEFRVSCPCQNVFVARHVVTRAWPQTPAPPGLVTNAAKAKAKGKKAKKP
jgi:hypothetical protein